MTLSTDQVNFLLKPLNPARVRQSQGNSHLEAWDIRRHLLRVFGWGGWDFHVVECTCISERSKWNDDNPLVGRHTVVYRVIGRLTIKSADGTPLAVFEDGAVGDGINQPSLEAAHDFALKTAMSQALKRCAVNLGDAFGLGLYNGGRVEPVVGASLAHLSTDKVEAQEAVRGGEMPDSTQTTSPDWTPGEGEAAPPVTDTAESHPSAPGSDEQALPPTEETVERFRQKVLDAFALDRREAAKVIARLAVEASQAKIMSEMTTSPKGEPMTVAVLLDEMTKSIARRQS